MATRVTDGASRPRFARLAASPLPRACIALTKSEEKERLLAVYIFIGVITFVLLSKFHYNRTVFAGVLKCTSSVNEMRN